MKKIFAILSFSLNLAIVVGVVEPGPSYPPTNGEVWPKPQSESKESFYYSFDPSNFRVQITGHNCSILRKAIERYSYVYVDLYKLVQKYGSPRRRAREAFDVLDTNENNDHYYRGNLILLNIDVKTACEEYPYHGMDESYNLNVSETTNLVSNSIWGAIRGLETFAQLIYVTEDFKALRLNKTTIVDFPRSSHRGILLDTSRHFISLNNIFTLIEGMAMNKMNVFHWHIVDDQSFPYQSDRFPDLSAKGAYHPSMVYTRTDIEMVIDFARNRGIRVIPEFDVPGHTRSWGEAFPQLLSECYRAGHVIGLGPMDPIRKTTYALLRELFKEVQNLFKDEYFHIGGDEVQLSCWSSNPELQRFMVQHGIHDVKKLHALFMQNALPLLANGSKPIVWEEVFTEGVPLPPKTLVQIWKGGWRETSTMVSALQSGFQVLYSSSWYLDYLNQGFTDFYLADPWQMVIDNSDDETLAKGVVGGEACMWGEMVDDRNLLSRIWPRASATAEKLWSNLQANSTRSYRQYSVPKHTMCRIEEHTCRMVRRRVPAQPSGGPGYCVF